MKKFAFGLLVLIFAVSAAGGAFAADPFKVHKGGFGPKMKGLQLGMPMTWVEAVAWGSQYRFPVRIFFFQGPRIVFAIDITGEEGKVTGWKIVDGTLQAEFENKQELTLGELFEELKRKGVDSANIGGITVRNDRVAFFELLKGKHFDAESMPLADFVQALVDTYKLGTVSGNARNGYDGQNASEGWAVQIGPEFLNIPNGAWRVTMSAISISKGSFD
ncbi:MAG: hypothetical protein LBP21_03230 [Synergistaceae bacterium]|nr:hypothetical protein [Synergistaceae bacterium]